VVATGAIVTKVVGFSTDLTISEGNTEPVFPVVHSGQMQVQNLRAGDTPDAAGNPTRYFSNLAVYRDGTVRRYLVTEAGDVLAQLNKPEPSRWRKLLPDIQDWQNGTIEPLLPFTPPVNQLGSLLPGRLLVLSFAPKPLAPAAPAERATGSAARSALRCLGGPVALLGGLGAGGLALGLVTRSKRGC